MTISPLAYWLLIAMVHINLIARVATLLFSEQESGGRIADLVVIGILLMIVHGML